MAFIERGLGRLFFNFKKRDDKMICNQPDIVSKPNSIEITSSWFNDNEDMPLDSSADGKNLSPPLQWKNLPTETRDVILLLEDPDAPLPTPILHMACQVPFETINSVDEGKLNFVKDVEAPVKFYPGAFGRLGYHGPRPVRAHGPHRYIFQIYALSQPVSKPIQNRNDLIAIIAESSIARGTLTGTYERF